MVAAAVIGSAVVGGVASKSAAKKGAAAQNAATAAAAGAEAERLELDRERFDFEKAQYEAGDGDRDFASQTARDVAGRQLQSMDQQYKISDDYWNYQKDTFRPLETGLVEDAADYDTTARRNAAAGSAVADVGMRMDMARDQESRALSRAGVAPGSGKAMAISGQNALGGAVAKAGAANKARTDIETRGFAMKMDAAGLGRNLATNQTSAANSALAQGNASVSNSGVPISVANSGTQQMSSAYGNLSSGLWNNANRSLQIGGIQSQNFYDSQRFGAAYGASAAQGMGEIAKFFI